MPDEGRFQFGSRYDEPEMSFNEDGLSQRLARLNRRVSFLMLALPLMLALALYVGYQDLARQTAKSQSAELRSLEKVAAEADLKISAFEARLAAFESTLTSKIESEQKGLQELQKNLQVLKEELQKGEAEIGKLDASKSEKKDLAEFGARVDAALAGIQKELQSHGRDLQSHGRELQSHGDELQALAPFREELGSSAALRNDISSVAGRLQRLENLLGKDLTGMAGYLERIKTDLDKAKSDLAGLQARKIDRETLELEALKTKRLIQMALEQEVARIDRTIAGYQRRLDQLEKAFGVR